MQFATYPSLRERAVFISGGASGIGAAIVEHFAAQGSRVAFVDVDDAAAANTMAAIRAAGHAEPFYQRCDLRDIAALKAAVATSLTASFAARARVGATPLVVPAKATVQA